MAEQAEILLSNERFSSLFLVFIVAIIFLIVHLTPVQADVISINGGGDATGHIIVNPNTFIENFFSGVTYCGDGIIQNPDSYGVHEQCDLGSQNGVSGSGCSSSCQVENVTPPPSGGGGGGTPQMNIVVTPSWNTNLGLQLAVNTTRDETISVKNNGPSSVSVSLTDTFKDHMQVLGNDTLTIGAGQSSVFHIRFVAGSTPDTITGKITIGNTLILSSLDVTTKILLFDSNIVVLNKNLQVEQGSPLQTQVSLIPRGSPQRLDVTLNFVIKDFNNKVYLTKSETILVQNQTILKRDFDTGSLPVGSYVIGLQLVYPNGVAPSSARFDVTAPVSQSILGKIVLFLLMLIVLVLIVIIILIIIRRRRKQTSLNANT